MLKTIFIIGNGFDLAHGLKTRYSDFLVSVNSGRNKLLRLLKNNADKWSDIELNYFRILCNYDNEVFFRTTFKEHPYSSASKLNAEFDEIKVLLSKYLIEAEKEFKPISSFNNLFKEFDDKYTLFLDFNYTKCVSNYVKDNSSSHHIKLHGELNSNSNPIIFGYAANNYEERQLSEKNDNLLMRNIKRLNYLQSSNHQKLKDLIKDNIDNSIYIYILGHSCGTSDRLILSELFNNKRVKNITALPYQGLTDYNNLIISINRVMEDYNKYDESMKSFSKITPFSFTSLIPQHDSNNQIHNDFVEFVNKIKLTHEKHNPFRIL